MCCGIVDLLLLLLLQAKPGQLLMTRYLVAAGNQLEHMDARR
jgi:hypothetical protein